MGSMVNFQVQTLNGIRSGPFGPKKSMESMGPMGPMGPGPMGPGPGPGPFLVGGRPQQKHVLEKSDASHAEKKCLINICRRNINQGVNN